MVEGTSFMGLGEPNLVKGAKGETSGAEEFGGAAMHTKVSGVAHQMARNDEECIGMLRAWLHEIGLRSEIAEVTQAQDLYDTLPDDHRQPYDTNAVLGALLDAESI